MHQTHRRRFPIAAGLLAAALVLAACGGSAEEGSTTTGGAATTTEALGETPGLDAGLIAEIAGHLAEDRAANGGYLSTQAALDLFAAAYGPVPGADPERIAVVGPGDGTMAGRNVLRVWESLTAEQQAAVAEYLDLPEAQAYGAIPNGVLAAYEVEEGAYLLGLRETADLMRDEIAARLDRTLGVPLTVVVADLGTGRGGGRILGDSLIVGTGDAATCRIRFIPGLSGAVLSNSVAHEVFHCFQNEGMGGSWDPDWITEGQARWVGDRLGGADENTGPYFFEWTGGSARSLFAKDYAAAGLYWVLEQAGADPWAAMPAMWLQGNLGALAATGLAPADVLRWMSTTGVHANLSPAIGVSAPWQLTSPDVPPGAVRGAYTATPDSPVLREPSLEAFGWGAWDIALEGDVALVEINAPVGAFEFEGKGFSAFDGSFTGRFCLLETGCTCEGEDPLPEGSERLIVGVGSDSGGTVSLSVRMVDLNEAGFADGHWTGALTATPIFISATGQELEGNPLSAPFELTVEEGRVTGGTYSVAAELSAAIPGQAVAARGTGTIAGTFAGCAFSPRIIPASFTFAGTMSIGGVETPFNFALPMGDAEIEYRDALWEFGTRSPDAVAGILRNQAFLEFMRMLDLTVNDVVVTFAATRDG